MALELCIVAIYYTYKYTHYTQKLYTKPQKCKNMFSMKNKNFFPLDFFSSSDILFFSSGDALQHPFSPVVNILCNNRKIHALVLIGSFDSS